MSQTKLFEYNSSFGLLRTNPKLTGNIRITVDSFGGVALNSMSVNSILSNKIYKKYNISGKNTFARDISDFFSAGTASNDVIFEVGEFTSGKNQAVENYSDQYDFYYCTGANMLIDSNYKESFSYFAPLWLKNEIPEYFVIFKLNDPLDYKYTENVKNIQYGIKYKIIQDYDSPEPFIISYGNDEFGNAVYYNANNILTGNNNNTYEIISGIGKVVIYDELYNLKNINNINKTFSDKILNKATAIKTFDLGENTIIGKYIRDIFNNSNFSKSPIEINYGYNSYSYYNGISISDGVYTKKGELLNQFLSSSNSDAMIDLENYITSGFQRNGIICQNIVNLEFLFDDNDSDMYSINRYFGMYVSKNDIGNIRLNGEFFSKYKDIDGNNNIIKKDINLFGYYYNNESKNISSETGIRLFYEDAKGFIPGSNDINITNSKKLFYLVDKNNIFYSFKRKEGYDETDASCNYGAFNEIDNTFDNIGITGNNKGSIVIQNNITDILNFTGTDNKIATIKGELSNKKGNSYINITFNKKYDKNNNIVFKINWPNGSRIHEMERYDIIRSADLSSIMRWDEDSSYSIGNNYYFNILGDSANIAKSFSSVVSIMDNITINSGIDNNNSILRLSDDGAFGNETYSISIFENYDYFEQHYKGIWYSNDYDIEDIVLCENNYYISNSIISSIDNLAPNISDKWEIYKTFSDAGYIQINDIDVTLCNGNINFIGGLDHKNRIIFNYSYRNLVKPNYFIKTSTGYSRIISVNRYVDEDILNENCLYTFKDFSNKFVANLEDSYSAINLGSNNSFNLYDYARINVGVFTFFPLKEFDFDFLSSNYSYTPTPELYKYYKLESNKEGIIKENEYYLVKSGQILYNEIIYYTGDIFIGINGKTSFKSASLNKEITDENIVFPARYSNVKYIFGQTNYIGVDYSNDLDKFNGFLGIQSLYNKTKERLTKFDIFTNGKLDTEYQYLNENYTVERSNLSRIVPFINKWGSSLGTDARGNKYRLNSSPAFSPNNFSPSFDKLEPDAKYLTHEWMLLEEPPIDFPIEYMNDQKSYLPNKIDLDKAKNVSSNDDYLLKYFTIEPNDYSDNFKDESFHNKELFTNFIFNEASGFYETIFRGVKLVLKKKTNFADKKHLNNYRGYENYKFSAIIRPIKEDNNIIQAPVKYRVIENEKQKFILFICDIVINDQKAGTSDNPKLDYALLYTLNDKEISNLKNNNYFYKINDIKLSCSLDLSLQSGSIANSTTKGRINIYPNNEYDTDLREEINLFYPENTNGQTDNVPSDTGDGSFEVPLLDSTYPWPIGVGKSYIELGKLVFSEDNKYAFTIPFSIYSNGTNIPIGLQTIYKDKPVIQKKGGANYYKKILNRCSVAYISDMFNRSSNYIDYKTYRYNTDNKSNVEVENDFELYFEKPTNIIKKYGSISTISYDGPQVLIGAKIETGAKIIFSLSDYPSIINRYSGKYEPLFRDVLYFDNIKNDKIKDIDISFRNCTFAPNKKYFGILRNLGYSKVSEENNILKETNNYPNGARYPLLDLTPIAYKDFNIFSSSWDSGYYNKSITNKDIIQVAGTRSMKEIKTFFGSKMMKTPQNIRIYNYVTLEISRKTGETNISLINNKINEYIEAIKDINIFNSNTGIGNIGTYLSGVDYNSLDMNLFNNIEIIWQNIQNENKIKGIIRLDRMLRRYLLNSGVKKVFIDNIISDFGTGDPSSINDDIINYIDLNIAPSYTGNIFNLYIKKTPGIDNIQEVNGDILTADKYRMGYYKETNYKLTKINNLVYEFEYNIEKNHNHSLLFNFVIDKI